MKRIFSFVAACATMFALAACQEELQQPVEEQKPVLEGIEGELQEVTFTVTTPDDAQTKAISDGLKATELEYAVYRAEAYVAEDGTEYPAGEYIPVLSQGQNAKIEKNGERNWTVTLTLAKNVKYDVVFWAYAKNAPYTFDEENAKIVVNNYTDAANDEVRDAFFGRCDEYAVVTTDTKVKLRRPFAQINFAADDYVPYVTDLHLDVTSKIDTDYHAAEEATAYEVARPAVAQTLLPTVLNVLDGTVGEPKVVDFALGQIPYNTGDQVLLEVDNGSGEKKPYYWVSMNYVLAAEGENTIDNIRATFNYNGENLKIDVPNVPYKRNYKTNILGTLFTGPARFNVVICPDYYTPDTIINLWDGVTVSAPAIVDGEYIITTGAELAWVANQVNSGKNDFAGKKVLIASDIRLANFEWTPIGTDEHPFRGSIEALAVTSLLTKSAAEYYTISGLYVNETEGPAGFVGVLKGGEVINLSLVEPNVNGESFVGAVVGKIFPDGLVDGVTVTGGQVNGNHFVGGLVGHAYGSVKNSVVNGTVVTGTPVKDNEDLDGDKVGGVIGYHAPDADGTEVSGNKVLDVTVFAKRDAGAVAGAANADNVKNNHVEKATVGSAEAPIAKNAGIIVGRVLTGTLNPKANTYNHENIYVNGEQAKPAEYKFEVTYDAEATNLPVEGGSVTVKVAGNVAWTVAVPEGVTASLAEGEGDAEVTFTVGANEKTEVASYTIVIATEEEACEVKSYKILVNQAAAKPEFVKATVTEFLAAAEDETVYELTGVITSVANTTYGNFYLKDATGEVYIYGLCSPEGAQKYWAESGAKVGDTITVRTVRTSHKGAPQGKDAIFVALVPFVAQASEWGIVGDFTEWGKNADVVMYNTWHTENLFVAYNVEIASGAFKIRANNEWNDAKNYGLEAAGSIYADKYYAMKSAGDSKDATLMAYGTYDVYFDLANKRVALMTPGKAYAEAVDGGQPIVVVAGLKDHAWGVAGSFQGWSAENATEAVVEGDWAIVKNVTLAANDEFKFVADKAWTISYGSACDVNVGETYTTYNNGGNMKFVGEPGTYNLYFSLIDAKFHMEEYVEAPAETTAKVVMKDLGYANAAKVTTVKMDENVTLTFAKGKASTDPAYYTSGESVRLYQNGATLTVNANGKTIKSIKITFADNQYYIAADSGEFSAEGTVRTWTGAAESVKFTTTGTDKNHRAYVSAIEVTYE